MRIPTDDQFSAVPWLQLLGVLGPILSIAQADGGDGLTWMLAELKTEQANLPVLQKHLLRKHKKKLLLLLRKPRASSKSLLKSTLLVKKTKTKRINCD